jgi:hypothetical protein
MSRIDLRIEELTAAREKLGSILDTMEAGHPHPAST